MSKRKNKLERKSSAQPAIGKECGALDDNDLAKVTGGDKKGPKVAPTETVSFGFGHIEIKY
jgi:hypothetical protein